jgi:hypothetical protein
MATKIAINGFGRIGRQVTKALFQKYKGDFDLVAVNDLGDVETNAHLFKYDSNYGIYPGEVKVDGSDIVVDGDRITVLSERDPSKLPWKDLGVEIVLKAQASSPTARKPVCTSPPEPKSSSFLHRPKAKILPSAWVSTMTNMTPPTTTSSATQAAPPTVLRQPPKSSATPLASSKA